MTVCFSRRNPFQMVHILTEKNLLLSEPVLFIKNELLLRREEKRREEKRREEKRREEK